MKQKIAKLLMIVGIGLFSYNIVAYSTNFKANLLPLSKFAIGLVAISLPWYLKKSWFKQLDDSIYILYFLFILATLYAGERFGFYSTFEHYDSVLHFSSGALLTLIGYEVWRHFMQAKPAPIIVIVIFVFCFAMTLGIFWELYEYMADGLMDLNLQRYMDRSGHEVLWDTMKDIVVNMAGSLTACIYIFKNHQRSIKKS